jgi:hypothetical protein
METGGNIFSIARRGGNASSSTNCLAEMSFLGQVQRTSQVFNTTEPTWSRSEELYFDVTLPIPKLAAEAVNDSAASEKLSACAAYHYGAAPLPVMSLCLLHTDRTSTSTGKKKKKGAEGSKVSNHLQDPELLGLCSIDFLYVITGQLACFDQWLPLFGGDHVRGEVRVIAEYSPTDPGPRPGDLCRLTGFCRPADVFPVPVDLTFVVDEVKGEFVYLSYSCPEGWICCFGVHQYTIITAERHQAVLELYQEQVLEITSKLKYSPMVSTVAKGYTSIPTEGLLGLGKVAVSEGFGVLSRWMEGGVDIVVEDLVYATNWDGQHTPNVFEQGEGLDAVHDDSDDEPFIAGAKGSKLDIEGPEDFLSKEALPGMPACPITGQPMRDPVVAGDGHTYERSAISRWIENSDISPITRAHLPHKGLAPNYLLISSVSAENGEKEPKDLTYIPKNIEEVTETAPSRNAVEETPKERAVQVADPDVNEDEDGRPPNATSIAGRLEFADFVARKTKVDDDVLSFS